MGKWAETILILTGVIGGSHGDAFDLRSDDSGLVQNIRFYMKDDGTQCLKGLDVTFSRGKKATAGGLAGNTYQDFKFDTGERITTMTLWGNGVGTRVGRIEFKTNKDKSFAFGKDVKDQKAYPLDVGSGYLVGFYGKAGADLDALGAYFLKDVKTAFIDNVSYPDLDLLTDAGATPVQLASAEYPWGGIPQTAKFSDTEERQEITTFTYGFTEEIGVEIGIMAGIPDVAMVKDKVTVKLGSNQSHTKTTTKIHRLMWESDIVIDGPKTAVRCTATCYEGKFDMQWTGRFNVVASDGSKHQFAVDGMLQSVSYSSARVTTEPLDPSISTASESRSAEDDEEQWPGEMDEENVDAQDQQDGVAYEANSNEEEETCQEQQEPTFQAEENTWDQEEISRNREESGEHDTDAGKEEAIDRSQLPENYDETGSYKDWTENDPNASEYQEEVAQNIALAQDEEPQNEEQTECYEEEKSEASNYETTEQGGQEEETVEYSETEGYKAADNEDYQEIASKYSDPQSYGMNASYEEIESY